MKAETYAALLKDLQKLQKTFVAWQIDAVRADPAVASKLQRLHAEAEVGGRIDDFVGTTARKSTVLLLLRTVFVRVLEDLGILRVKRIRDEWGFAAFREVAPALGIRSYFAFIFRDLAVDFPALFAPGEDELPLPDEDNCRALWNLWHHPNRDGELYVWNGDGFDSRFLGDLYQDLDADIRKRYALLQTPRFIEEYILDQTLTPALAEFDPQELKAAGERFRVLDPTCGSGHFLIGAFHRLADYWRDSVGLPEWAACEQALESVWGCDINPHAVEIADFRLLLEVVARTGVKDLDRLAELKLCLSAMDSLIPWERAATQGDLFPAKDRLDAYATQKQRRDSAAFLGRAFHVVVGNPPYITPKDLRKRDDYRAFWPQSTFRKYALSSPFVERFFSLSVPDGFVGQITSNSFMKRGFGKKLIEEVLPKWDLQKVVDTSGAHIPGHGTPTVLMLGRARRPLSSMISVILGKRGEPKRPTNPAAGRVWTAIRDAGQGENDESPFITVTELSRTTFATHPWSLGGGFAGEAKELIELNCSYRLGAVLSESGFGGILGEDEVYILPGNAERRYRLPPTVVSTLAIGDQLRDFGCASGNLVVFPYSRGEVVSEHELGGWAPVLWSYRASLNEVRGKGFRTKRESGKRYYEYAMFYPRRYHAKHRIAFAFVSTGNHFVLQRGDALLNRSAPILLLKNEDAVNDHLDLLGMLNTSTLGFWMKQVFHNKGSASGEAIRSEEWEPFWEYDSTKLKKAPITVRDRDARVALAKALDAIAQERGTCLPAAVLSTGAWSPASVGTDLSAAHQRFLAHTGRMVALQEELDWLTYGSFGLIEPVATVGPDAIESLGPGHRPFEITLARRDEDADDDEKSAWWSRHGHERVAEVPESYSAGHRARLDERIDRIESDLRLALLETPPYKRRWQLPDWASETRKAAESWLLNRLEDLFAPSVGTIVGGPLAEPKPYRLEDIAAACSRDPRMSAVAGVWTGTGPSVDITLVVEKLLRTNAVPDNPNRLYSDEGLRKLDEWKRVWALQDQEDNMDKAVAGARARGEPAPRKRLIDPEDPSKEIDTVPLPRKFDKHDFLKSEFFSLRGKLNIPRERFILFADLSPNRFGWNGWRVRERSLAQVEAFTVAENDPQQPLSVPTSDDPRRCGVTYGLWESLPDVQRWGARDEYAELHALAREACRQPRCPCPIVEAWKSKALNSKVVHPTTKAKGADSGRVKDQTEPAATVSLAARAWVASLFQPGKDLEAASIWSRHRSRLAEPAQRTIPTTGAALVQLAIPEFVEGPPADLVSLDQVQLALILDDLVASGDLQVRGRGTKKRFQLVPRGISS